MMTDKQLIARLLELQEHPDQVTDEQLQQMLGDEQMYELVEQVAFAKRAFKKEESLAEVLPVDDEWEKFAARHAEELTNAAGAESKHASLSSRLVASFIGAVLASSIALAAIYFVRQKVSGNIESPTQEVRNTNSPLPVSPTDTIKSDTLAIEPRIFDNVPLDTMLFEMADYYHVNVVFEREDTRQFRFHFVWKREDSLMRVVEKLNTFEAVNIGMEDKTLVVR